MNGQVPLGFEPSLKCSHCGQGDHHLIKLTLLLTILLLASCAGLPKLPVLPVPLLNAPTPQEEVSADEIPVPNVSARFNAALIKLLPKPQTATDKQVFTSWSLASVQRSPNWLRGFDFSGVAWDTVRTCTLIHPQAVTMARHYQRNVGDKLTFHDRDGNQVIRTLVDKIDPSISIDITLGWLDSPVANCEVYPVLPSDYDWATALYGTYCFVTDQERKTLLYMLSSWSPTVGFYGRDGSTSDIMREALISGDSGGPCFLPYGDNKLALLATNWFGGQGAAGPNFAHPAIQEATRLALVNLINRNP
jgi:hypothetical protein